MDSHSILSPVVFMNLSCTSVCDGIWMVIFQSGYLGHSRRRGLVQLPSISVFPEISTKVPGNVWHSMVNRTSVVINKNEVIV